MSNTLILKMWDHDKFKKNDPLGNASVGVGSLPPRSPHNVWLDLQGEYKERKKREGERGKERKRKRKRKRNILM